MGSRFPSQLDRKYSSHRHPTRQFALLLQHPAPMRNYYFWYVLCAAVVKIFHLPARAVLTASCVWAGFALAAIIGLFLKHFLAAGARLRRQFLITVGLLCVTGIDICVNVFELFLLHHPLPLDLEWWSHDEIYSWYGSVIWVPHHVTALVVCMFALLLAWLSASEPRRVRIVSTVFIALALAALLDFPFSCRSPSFW